MNKEDEGRDDGALDVLAVETLPDGSLSLIIGVHASEGIVHLRHMAIHVVVGSVQLRNVIACLASFAMRDEPVRGSKNGMSWKRSTGEC